MQRDLSALPRDEDGDLLWEMRLAGDDLTTARNVNFCVLFETEPNAYSFAAEMREAAFDVQVDELLETFEVPAWEVVVTSNIIPAHERITTLGDLIATMADSHSGYPDGWDAELLSPNN